MLPLELICCVRASCSTTYQLCSSKPCAYMLYSVNRARTNIVLVICIGIRIVSLSLYRNTYCIAIRIDTYRIESRSSVSSGAVGYQSMYAHVPLFCTGMMWFDAFRKDRGPTQYAEKLTPVTYDVVVSGFLYASVILSLSVFSVLPGFKERQVGITAVTTHQGWLISGM